MVASCGLSEAMLQNSCFIFAGHPKHTCCCNYKSRHPVYWARGCFYFWCNNARAVQLCGRSGILCGTPTHGLPLDHPCLIRLCALGGTSSTIAFTYIVLLVIVLALLCCSSLFVSLLAQAFSLLWLSPDCTTFCNTALQRSSLFFLRPSIFSLQPLPPLRPADLTG
jgi:hypothetical protein